MIDVHSEIIKERERQVLHGYDAKHDAQHTGGQILSAAILIAMDVASQDQDCWDENDPESDDWTVNLAGYVRKKHGPDFKRRLIIAVAMIVAEIERIDRAEGH